MRKMSWRNLWSMLQDGEVDPELKMFIHLMLFVLRVLGRFLHQPPCDSAKPPFCFHLLDCQSNVSPHFSGKTRTQGVLAFQNPWWTSLLIIVSQLYTLKQMGVFSNYTSSLPFFRIQNGNSFSPAISIVYIYIVPPQKKHRKQRSFTMVYFKTAFGTSMSS